MWARKGFRSETPVGIKMVIYPFNMISVARNNIQDLWKTEIYNIIKVLLLDSKVSIILLFNKKQNGLYNFPSKIISIK